MKSLKLTNSRHIHLEKSFKDFLETTGYAVGSVYNMPLHVREFLYWAERENKKLKELQSADIRHYFFQLRERKKQRAPAGAISPAYLKKHLQALRLFSRYLRETDQASFEVDIILPEPKRKIKILLSRANIKALYNACDTSPIGLRDRAMLAVYYGCGLRRSEGVALDVSDLISERQLLYVRKGKNYRERYVPMTGEVRRELEDYLRYGRPSQLKDLSETAYFLSERGQRISGQSLVLRLKHLLKKAELEDFLETTGLHTLRHSIATHLMQSGMSLSRIARFLGHASLEATQIYTHLACETEN